MTEPGNDKYSESTLKLSERYGIDPARLDAILGKPKHEASVLPAIEPTREWIEERRIHQPNVDPAATMKEPMQTGPVSKEPLPKEPVKIVDPVVAAPPPPPLRKVKDIRLEGSSLAGTARNEKTYTYQKQSTSPLTWIIGVVILGLLAIMFFMARGCDQKPQQKVEQPTTVIDTVVKTDTLATTDTVAVPSASPAPAPAVAAKPASNPKPRARRTSTAAPSSSRNVALSTTSSFAAQERLAELKADGNRNAKIQRVTKNGVVVYKVRTK